MLYYWLPIYNMSHVWSESPATIFSYLLLYPIVKCALLPLLLCFLVFWRIRYILADYRNPYRFWKVAFYMFLLLLLNENLIYVNDYLIRHFVEFYVAHFMPKIDYWLWHEVFKGSAGDDFISLCQIIWDWGYECFGPPRAPAEKTIRLN